MQEDTSPVRKIIHVDMDAFYASVEQRDNPELRGKPVAVGFGEARGVVAAASYEARKFGVHSAMASVTAMRKCPDLIFVRPRFDVYRAVSLQTRAIFAEYTPLIEPLSLDEAYLDVTDNLFVAALPVKKFHGVGPATAEKMQRLGIETGADLREKSLDFLQQNFGKSGPYFYGIARGIDNRQVKSDRIRKSIGAEDTFRKDIHLLGEAVDRIEPLVGKVWGYCDANDIRARTITVKIKYADFRQVTRSRSISSPLASEEELMDICQNILTAEFPIKKGVRLLGVTLSSLEKANSATQEQFDLGL
ncbi:DNA polymerase IV [Neorhizobium sp. P12A]|uniref:Y-family DNA polymerase n=1 Tax=Neorhizobium sp. P12A TaxID=2268027 RepID=UPI0011EDB2D0|nr:DNA polymerase IV [Neorhizobium sp. P12A]KAA0684831.1 DNA polymerase IV [Neorhizobium sp. P12A]